MVFVKVEVGKIKHKWSCTKCEEVFGTSIKLRSHRKSHRQEESDVHYNYRFDDDRNLYICNTCDTEISSKEEIENHIIEHEDKFVCEICKQNFYKPYEFSCHIYKHDPKKGFNCPLCKYETNRRTDIWKHIKIRHLHKYKYNCVQCGKGFTNRVLFTEHNNIHEGVKPFVCVVCSKSFVYSSYLYNHQIHNHLVNIGATQCTICFKSFVQKKSLRKHLRSHEMMSEKMNKEKKHLCDICGKGFAQNEKLKIHYRVHTGDKPYSCSYCGKSFTKRDYLVMHERVHSGEKPYACEYCGKRFNQGAPLRLHIRSHTGERPYKCHLCNNGFISRSVLNLHLKNCLGVSE